MSLTISQTMSMRGVRRWGAIIMLSVMLWGPAAQAATVAEPIFDAPKYGEKQLTPGLMIAGSAETGTTLEIAIDGERAGRVPLASSSGPRAQFTYVPAEPLAPGYHAVEAFATDPAGQKYAKQSLWWWFHVRDPLPAPVILQMVERARRMLAVTGVVKSGYRVRLYVDGKEAATSATIVHASGTGSFSLLLGPLPAGPHTVRVALVRPEGGEGQPSEAREAAITGTVAEAPAAVPAKGAAPKAPSAPVAQVTQPAPAAPSAPVTQGVPKETPVPPAEKPPVKPSVPSVIILPPPTSTVQDAAVPPEEPQAPRGGSSGQLIALIVLGILLAALIIWYATRRDGGNPPGEQETSMNPSSPPPPSRDSSAGYADATADTMVRTPRPPGRSALSQGLPSMDEADIPPPPPPPNFASRMDF